MELGLKENVETNPSDTQPICSKQIFGPLARDQQPGNPHSPSRSSEPIKRMAETPGNKPNIHKGLGAEDPKHSVLG